jgi:lipid IVA palmitoyltransferase
LPESTNPSWLRIATFLLALTAGGPAHACDWAGRWLEYTCDRLKESIDHGRNDLYIPGYTIHGRSTYTPEKLSEFNDHAWGFGYGRSVTDAKGDWYGLYGMAFRDSHYKPEYLGGWGYQTYWGSRDSLQAGLGYTVFATVRSDYGHYLIPLPAILPLASVRYGNMSLMASYVPRLSANKGNGDVLFFFAQIGF